MVVKGREISFKVLLCNGCPLHIFQKVSFRKLEKKCFIFLWTIKREKEGIPLVKWIKVANLKDIRGGV